jgi:hypothetical protein
MSVTFWFWTMGAWKHPPQAQAVEAHASTSAHAEAPSAVAKVVILMSELLTLPWRKVPPARRRSSNRASQATRRQA